jgi:predicted Zn finger-like uncharacterized protein
VLIRCEKCSTLYELDDKLLPPQGAPVQCSRCQFVFKAYPAPPSPPSAPERAANDARGEAAPEPRPVEAEARPRSDEFVREGGALAHSFDRPTSRPATAPTARPASPSAPPVDGETSPVPSDPSGASAASGAARPPADGPKFTADGRPIRKVPFPVGDSLQPGPRTPPLRGSTSSPARTGSGAVRWVLATLVLLAVLAGAAFAWHSLRSGSGGRDPGAAARQSRPIPQDGTTEPPSRN